MCLLLPWCVEVEAANIIMLMNRDETTCVETQIMNLITFLTSHTWLDRIKAQCQGTGEVDPAYGDPVSFAAWAFSSYVPTYSGAA